MVAFALDDRAADSGTITGLLWREGRHAQP